MLPRGFAQSWNKSKFSGNFSGLKFKQERDQQLEYFVHQVTAAQRQQAKENKELQSEIDDFESGVREKIEERLVPKKSKSNTNFEMKTFIRADSAQETPIEPPTAKIDVR